MTVEAQPFENKIKENPPSFYFFTAQRGRSEMDNVSFSATLQDSASALYRNNITPLLQRCASYMGQPQPRTAEASMLSVDTKRALQQADNLKWQQDMFHRLLNLVCLSKEGLVPQQQVGACRTQVLDFLKSPHPDGEWAEFTRDKLLYLQDLLFAACISENEYHVAKKPLILRLADQGAIIDAEDFIFNSSATSDAKVMRTRSAVRTPSSRRAKARSMTESNTLRMPAYKTEADASTKATSTSPLKQVMGAVCRLNKTSSGGGSSKHTTPVKMEKESHQLRVPHALDFLRPEHCPMRDPPSPQQLCQKTKDLSITKDKKEEPLPVLQPDPSADDLKDGDVCNWCSPISSPNHKSMADTIGPFSGHTSPLERGSASKSPSTTPSRFRNMLTGLIQKKTLQSDAEKSPKSLLLSKGIDSDGEEEEFSSNNIKGSKRGLEMLRFRKRLHFDQEENPADNAERTTSESVHGCSRVQLLAAEGGGGQGPHIRRLKKKVHSKGAPTDFFIDKVLGENIKNELSRIRAEMNRTQPGQTFTNEQIDAIATKLPMDKAELKKFFPQTWCERYGDIVLEVVGKEFKEHVSEMQRLGEAVKDKKQQCPSSPAPLKHNDENMEGSSSPLEQHQHQLPRRIPDFSKCFRTRDENTPMNSIPWGSSSRKKEQPAGTTESPTPIKEKNRCKPTSQQQPCGRLNRDMASGEDNLDKKLEEEVLKMQGGTAESPIKEKNRGKPTLQQRHGRRLNRDITSAEDNLDCKLEEEVLKMPLRRLNEYGSHLRI